MKVRELCSSHIYPRWSVKFPKPKEQHFYSLKGGDQPQLGLPQDALKEYLLCGECEGLIGRSEDDTCDLLLDEGRVVRPRPKQTAINRAEYGSFELFQLSVLWRVHVSRDRFFKQVDLGPRHAERRPHRTTTRLRREGHHVYGFTFAALVWMYVVSQHAGRHPLAASRFRRTGRSTSVVLSFGGRALGSCCWVTSSCRTWATSSA